MGRTVKFYLPQNRAVFVHRPMGKLPPHEWVTTPWRCTCWLRERHICKGARPL